MTCACSCDHHCCLGALRSDRGQHLQVCGFPAQPMWVSADGTPEPLGNSMKMQKSYGVVWREGDRPIVAGKLELQARALQLEGRDGRCELPYDQLAEVHIGRSPAERIDGRASVVVQPRRGDALTISAVAQASLIG